MLRMGNTNLKSINSSFNRRPHSVIGLRSEEWYVASEKSLGSRFNANVKMNKTSGKALLPPLPRSHSFHQILRPTENGVNLLKKGTIRGVEGKGYTKDLIISNEDILNTELNAILKARRCRSEADLINQEPSSASSQEDRLSFDKSTNHSEKSECYRKSHSNGVAARIQRAKYRAPQPPIRENNTSSYVNLNPNPFEGKKLLNGKAINKKNSKVLENRPKVGLIRRLSEKSYLVKKTKTNEVESLQAKENPLPLPRLKASNEINYNPIVYNKKKSEADVCSSFHDFNDFVSREVTNNLNNCGHDLDKFKFNESKKSNFSRRDFNRNPIKLSSEERNELRINGLPPVFDDNFILRRVTPNAGLNSRNGNVFSSPTHSHLKSLHSTPIENDSDNCKSTDYSQSVLFSNKSNAKCKSKRFNQFSKNEIISYLSLLRSQKTQPSNLKLDNHNKEELFEKVHIKKLNTSYISDSANCSEEDDDEEEIKVVIRPFLPPPRRRPFLTDRALIIDDLFTGESNHVIQLNRKQCWTPMEDLTSSEDDDEINCHPNSEDDEMETKRDGSQLIHDYNTNFTFQNQLRTLIQNNKLRAQA